MPVQCDHHVVSMLPKLGWFIGSNGPANLVIDFSVHHSDIWPMPKWLCPKIRCSCIPNVDRLFVLIFLMKMTILCASPIFGHTVANPSISYIQYSIPCSIFIMFLLQYNISRHNSYNTPHHIHSYPVYPYMSCTPNGRIPPCSPRSDNFTPRRCALQVIEASSNMTGWKAPTHPRFKWGNHPYNMFDNQLYRKDFLLPRLITGTSLIVVGLGYKPTYNWETVPFGKWLTFTKDCLYWKVARTDWDHVGIIWDYEWRNIWHIRLIGFGSLMRIIARFLPKKWSHPINPIYIYVYTLT